jgi:hypothetical protein
MNSHERFPSTLTIGGYGDSYNSDKEDCNFESEISIIRDNLINATVGHVNIEDEARISESASFGDTILNNPIEAVLARAPEQGSGEFEVVSVPCWRKSGSLLRLLFVCILILLFVLVAIIVYSICDHECCCKQQSIDDSLDIQTSAPIPNDQLSEAERYLEKLRGKILGIDRSSLQPNAAQTVASDWMAFIDLPRVPLEERDRLIQRYALLVIYFAMGGLNSPALEWDKNLGIHECFWKRVICNENRMISELDLSDGVYLSGSIVQEIRLLSSLSKSYRIG